ncbi:tyrosine-type recombinase/integrase [Sphingomonas sp.]|uniref:tyrosine-type recombinase/integrase n=1 Tax=Sphingomonas sp. TaxID=28214 RepID=UPI003CC53A95
MPKARLDHTTCLLARCEEGKKKTDYYDDAVTGFVLECRESGGKTYYLRYDVNGQQKQRKIGRYEDVTFAQAKKVAQRFRSETVLGGDPAAEKAKARAVPIYAELAAQHMTDAKLHQKSYTTTEMYMRRHIVTRWGKVRLTDIDPRAVAQWLANKRGEGLSPATVLKIKMIFGRSFELGRQWGVAGCERNPVRGVKLPPVNNARNRYLTAEEAARLREAASASKNKQFRSIVDLLLLTGARVGELLAARREHVDIERQSWLIPTSKTGRARHVPLSAAALAVIEGLPRFDGCPWLLPNPKTRQPFTDLKHPWQTARDAARLPGLRIHDLRHSAASFMVNSGVDLFAVGKVLGHASVQSTQRYSHLANDTLLAAVEAGAAKQAQPA